MIYGTIHKILKKKRTELGQEEQEHNDGGSEGDDATGKGTAVEIFVDFWVRIQIPELAHYSIHAFLFSLNLSDSQIFFFGSSI